MVLGVNKLRARIALKMKEALKDSLSAETKEAFQEWIDNKENAEGSRDASEKVIAALSREKHPIASEILALTQYLVKKSIWVIRR